MRIVLLFPVSGKFWHPNPVDHWKEEAVGSLGMGWDDPERKKIFTPIETD